LREPGVLAPEATRRYIQETIKVLPMNIAVTRSADGLPRRAFTVDDIQRMIAVGVLGEDERFELVEGDLVMMSAKGRAHDLMKIGLNSAILRVLPDEMALGPEITIQFADSTLLEPDLAIFKRNALLASNANFIQLAPSGLLLAIEVAASSLAYDKGIKALLYARHGAKEFWVIDANERIAWIHTGPAGEGWSSIIECGPDEMLTTDILPGFSVRLSEIE
jgi:Uma2 family endonuclease